jgi:hypothetical protein
VPPTSACSCVSCTRCPSPQVDRPRPSQIRRQPQPGAAALVNT